MNELIKNIVLHKNTNSPKIIFYLMEFIKNNSVQSLDELQQLEDAYYTLVDSTKYSDEEIINKLYKDYTDDYDDYMNCTDEEKRKLDELNEEFLHSSDNDQKYIILIKMYTILDWDLVLPYHCYLYVMEDRLK